MRFSKLTTLSVLALTLCLAGVASAAECDNVKVNATYAKGAPIKPAADLYKVNANNPVTAARFVIYESSGILFGNPQTATVTPGAGGTTASCSATFGSGVGTSGKYYVELQVWYKNRDPNTTACDEAWDSSNFTVN